MERVVIDINGKPTTYCYEIDDYHRNLIVNVRHTSGPILVHGYELIPFFKFMFPYHVDMGQCDINKLACWCSAHLSHPFTFMFYGYYMDDNFREYFQLWDKGYHNLFLFSSKDDAMLFRLSN